MNIIILYLIIVSYVASSPIRPNNDFARKQFDDYINKFNKDYTADEFAQRFINFKASLVRIADKNEQARKATFGLTKFSDMSVHEFKSTILMKDPIKPSYDSTRGALKSKGMDIPVSFDWRSTGAVTPVKNQEQCGSCWAFSATENIESMWILAGKGTNESVDFAPQQIVDCDSYDFGCEGGQPGWAYDYVISAGGIESESAYPYDGEDGSCGFNASEVVGSIINWQYATEFYDESSVQQNLVGWGPLSVCVDAESWQDYESGVLTWEECAFINELDHCVQLVGYNTQDSSNPYWIVRNSWGADWGIDGYIWLQMWEDTCGITHYATSSIV